MLGWRCRKGEVHERAPGCPPSPQSGRKPPFLSLLKCLCHFAPEHLWDNHLPNSRRVILVNVAFKPADLPSTHPPQPLLLSPSLVSEPVPSWAWHMEFRNPRRRC